jgi:hypothetical protein
MNRHFELLSSTTSPLFDFNNPVNAFHCKGFSLAAGPAHLNGIYLLSISQYKVQAHIALREIAAATPHFSHLVESSCFDFDPSSDRVSIAGRPDKLYGYPIAFLPTVDQQVRGGVEVIDDNVERAIIE